MGLSSDPAVARFVQAARAYCVLIESPSPDRQGWAGSVLAALADLYAAAVALPEPDLDEFGCVPVDQGMTHPEWEALWRRLRDVLGRPRRYRAYCAPTEPPAAGDEPVVGDLADDLADIYGDVKGGLLAWDAGGDEGYLAEVVYGWKQPGFTSHWGVHAVGAMRALHPLVFLRGPGHL